VKRREFIALTGCAVAWPLAVRAQQAPPAVLGFLHSGTQDGYVPMTTAFRQGLNELGYIEGRNLEIDFRWANNRFDQLPLLALELVRRRVAVIAAGGAAAAVAAKAATTTIPIVFAVGIDPVDSGLVASLNQPGSNITGVNSLTVELAPKLLELIHEVLPAAKTIALLVNQIGRAHV